MKLNIVAPKLQVSADFQEYAEGKAAKKLDKFFGEEAEGKITLTEFKNEITVEFTVKYNNFIYRSEQTAADKRDALDTAIEKITRQIQKNKSKLTKHLKENSLGSFDDEVEEQIDFNIIKEKKIPVRPMSVEEAVLQMNMLSHTFFVFEDAGSGLIEIVYKRKDGHYAILIPGK